MIRFIRREWKAWRAHRALLRDLAAGRKILAATIPQPWASDAMSGELDAVTLHFAGPPSEHWDRAWDPKRWPVGVVLGTITARSTRIVGGHWWEFRNPHPYPRWRWDAKPRGAGRLWLLARWLTPLPADARTSPPIPLRRFEQPFTNGTLDLFYWRYTNV